MKQLVTVSKITPTGLLDPDAVSAKTSQQDLPSYSVYIVNHIDDTSPYELSM